MEERICINGVWYVREKISNFNKIKSEDVTNTLNSIWESDNWCFESSLILKGEDPTDHYPDPSLTITDKRGLRKDWVETETDNPRWMIGVLENDPESLVEANNIFTPEGLLEFQGFLDYLVDKGWLVKKEVKF